MRLLKVEGRLLNLRLRLRNLRRPRNRRRRLNGIFGFVLYVTSCDRQKRHFKVARIFLLVERGREQEEVGLVLPNLLLPAQPRIPSPTKWICHHLLALPVANGPRKNAFSS